MSPSQSASQYPVGAIVRDVRWDWLLRVEERWPGGAKLRYLHTGATLMATEAMLERGFVVKDCPNPYCDGSGWVTAGATGTTNAYRAPACEVGPHA